MMAALDHHHMKKINVVVGMVVDNMRCHNMHSPRVIVSLNAVRSCCLVFQNMIKNALCMIGRVV